MSDKEKVTFEKKVIDKTGKTETFSTAYLA